VLQVSTIELPGPTKFDGFRSLHVREARLPRPVKRDRAVGGVRCSASGKGLRDPGIRTQHTGHAPGPRGTCGPRGPFFGNLDHPPQIWTAWTAWTTKSRHDRVSKRAPARGHQEDSTSLCPVPAKSPSDAGTGTSDLVPRRPPKGKAAHFQARQGKRNGPGGFFEVPADAFRRNRSVVQ
jgi:hypothetical protein